MRRYTILALMLLLLGLALWADPWPDREGVAGPAQAMSLLSPTPTPTSAMLTTPYYGTNWVTAWFDHNPNSGMMNYTGGTGLPYDGHKGVDFSMSYQPVLAAAPGEVTQARWYNWALRESGYGLYVIISHANGYETRYAYHVVAIRRERPPEGRVTFVLVDEDGWEGVVAGDRSAGPAWGRC